MRQLHIETCRKMASADGLRHGFYTRKGGVSEGVYESLNVGLGSQDDTSKVHENRARVLTSLSAKTLCTLYQVHSARVVRMDGPWAGPPLEADAMVTTVPGLALGILTADCVPVLYADAGAGVIGIAHCGWQGTLKGIIGETLHAMEGLGAQTSQVTASIGPAIAQASYEVGEELYQSFADKEAPFARFFRPGEKPGKWQFDLPGLVKHVLQESGVKTIGHIAHDTYENERLYFSYRRATHRGERDYGRQISAIMLV